MQGQKIRETKAAVDAIKVFTVVDTASKQVSEDGRKEAADEVEAGKCHSTLVWEKVCIDGFGRVFKSKAPHTIKHG